MEVREDHCISSSEEDDDGNNGAFEREEKEIRHLEQGIENIKL